MKNSFISLFVVALVPMVSSAHLQLKKYSGMDAFGATCAFEVKSITFLNNMKHPLNERVEVIFGERTYVLSHPGTTDMSTGEVGFNHDLLQSISAVVSGAEAITILMSHNAGSEGPKELVYSKQDWKTNQIQKQNCRLN